MSELQAQTHQELLTEALLLTQKLQEKEDQRKFFTMFPDNGPLAYHQYPKIMEFFAAGATERERLLMAGNRVGKSEGGAYEIACHLTGLYPHWWTGRRFEKPIRIWVAGDTTKTVRDIIQGKLMGPPNRWGTGMIPGDKIIMDRISRISGVADAIDTIVVKHEGGWTNTLAFKSYEQGRKSFQGTEQDIIWLDEEAPEDVYSECLLRTMTTNGLVMLTFTPLSGMTNVVMSFLGNSPDEEHNDGQVRGKFYVSMTWDDAPHLDQATKDELWKRIPPHQRDARSKGIPVLGSGAIYPLSEDDITVDDFKIPDYWPRAYGMDVGWNNTAAAQGCRDPDTGILYITMVYKRGQAEPLIHADAISARVGKKTKGYIDPASRGRSQADGVTLYQTYVRLSLDLEFAVNSVETGLLECWEGLSTGKIKIFRSCREFFSEFRLYRRDDKGHVVKKDDHIMDAFRYLVMSAGKYLLRPRKGFEYPETDNLFGARNLYEDLLFDNANMSHSWLGS